MAWFTRDKPSVKREDGAKRVRTEGLWLKCDHCGQIVWRKALEDNYQVCPKCGHHGRLDARKRLAMLFDEGKFEEFDQGLVSTDPLEFVDTKKFSDRLAASQEATHLRDAIISAERQPERPARACVRHGAQIRRRQHGSSGGRGDYARH